LQFREAFVTACQREIENVQHAQRSSALGNAGVMGGMPPPPPEQAHEKAPKKPMLRPLAPEAANG
jgi:hypothetical protein